MRVCTSRSLVYTVPQFHTPEPSTAYYSLPDKEKDEVDIHCIYPSLLRTFASSIFQTSTDLVSAHLAGLAQI